MRYLFVLAMLTFTYGCGEEDLSYLENKKDDVGEAYVRDMDGIEPIIPEYPRLNNENCTAFLLEFGKEHPSNRVLISTNFGDIEVVLYDDTPIHRANFLYLIHRNYYNPTEIMRVVKGFVIQGGNSEEEEPQTQRHIIGEYGLPAEISRKHIHKKGALAMSRSYENNPGKLSAGYDFYLVHGRKPVAGEIYQLENERGYQYTEEQRNAYEAHGGAMHLDGEHTVFGEVVKGLDVIDTIAAIPVDQTDWPKKRVEVRMSIID